MIHYSTEDYGQENRDYSHTEDDFGNGAVENPRHMDDNTFHEDPEEDEDATSYGADNNRYNSYNDGTQETDDFDEEKFDEEEDLEDDFNDHSYNPDDFDNYDTA